MIHQNKDIWMRLVACLMTGIMVLMIMNRSIYLHTHINEQGEVIVHAHPYNKAQEKSGTEQHKHTELELLFLSSLEFFFLTGILSLTLLLLIPRASAFIWVESPYREYALLLHPGRAPPCSI